MHAPQMSVRGQQADRLTHTNQGTLNTLTLTLTPIPSQVEQDKKEGQGREGQSVWRRFHRQAEKRRTLHALMQVRKIACK